MQFLLWVTLIWSFSFSLIGEFLAGRVDPYLAVASRMALALLLFLPWLWRYPTPARQALALAGIGAVQLGLMYLLFYHSFLYLTVAEVLLFTILTPVYVAVLDQLWRRQPLRFAWLGPALLAVLGAFVIRYAQPDSDFWFGLLLVQAANLCFAFGQVAYRQLTLGEPRQQLHSFGWFFVGASVVAAARLCVFCQLATSADRSQRLADFALAWCSGVRCGLLAVECRCAPGQCQPVSRDEQPADPGRAGGEFCVVATASELAAICRWFSLIAAEFRLGQPAATGLNCRPALQ